MRYLTITVPANVRHDFSVLPETVEIDGNWCRIKTSAPVADPPALLAFVGEVIRRRRA